MKKLVVFLPLAIFLAFGFFYFKDTAIQIVSPPGQVKSESLEAKRPIMRVGLVSDSHNDNELLKKALAQVQGIGVNFVIGLGDWSDVGTVEELDAARKIFDESKLQYFLIPGDHDLWDSRNGGEDALTNYKKVFGDSSRVIDKDGIQIVLLDNSDIYKGISPDDWKMLENSLARGASLHLVFAHKTPFHPDSSHVMGEETPEVAKQAENLMNLMEKTHPCHSDPESEFRTKSKILNQVQDDNNCPSVDGFFSGDLHFFAKFSSKGGSTVSGKSPDASVKITTIGAVDADRNFQGPRFGVLTIFDDYSWEGEDIEIR